MKKRPPIPVYHLQERARKNFALTGLTEAKNIAHWNQAHRDDNYLLLFHAEGDSKVMVDFQQVTIRGCAIFCILPGQVHYGLSILNTSAWALAVESASIKESHRMILTEFAMQNLPVPIVPSKAGLFRDGLSLLDKLSRAYPHDTDDQTLNSMLEACICMFVSACRGHEQLSGQSALRPLLITRQFRSLLMVSFRNMKSPSEYAAALKISPSYLNEVVKDTTGHPVSYWIHQEIMLEARRMLFHTSSTVKEISHLLGYTDTTYFIRLFTKTAGMSPLQFRSNYRK